MLCYTLLAQNRVRVEYFDASGKLISSILDCVQGSGEYSIPVPVSKWPSGTYFQIFKAGKFEKTDRFAIIR